MQVALLRDGLTSYLGDAKDDLAVAIRQSMIATLDNISRAGGGSYRILPSSDSAPHVEVFEGVHILHYPAIEWTKWYTQWASLMQATGAYGAGFPLGDGTKVMSQFKTLAEARAGVDPQTSFYVANVGAAKLAISSLPTIDKARAEAKTLLNRLYPNSGGSWTDSLTASNIGIVVGAVAALGAFGYAAWKLTNHPQGQALIKTGTSMED